MSDPAAGGEASGAVTREETWPAGAAGSGPAEGARTVVVERVFRHSVEKLWRALTESTLLAEWLLENDFEPVAGRKFQFRREPMPGWDGVIDCEVLVVEPLRRLSYSWGTLGVGTVVLWTLTPAEGGTHVRMEHSGFGPGREANYKGAKYGWQKFFGNLERVVEGME
jgi:uncharacterized protein YndB with AHSA1/START domain